MSAIAEEKEISRKESRKPKLPKEIVLRCVVYPHQANGKIEYTAECIDLDIIVRGSTPRQAFQSLQEAVIGYLQVVQKGDHTGLIPRPSPWPHRAKYHLFALRAAIGVGVRNFLLIDFSPDPSVC